jgi:succinate dehydrogenase/fumarate reductase cytochrome b subunit
MGSNATLFTALAALVPASMLLSGSVFLFFKMRTVASFLQVFGAACLTIVVLTHLCEAINLLPMMQWGLPNSLGHYIDLWSAVLGFTSFPLGYLWQSLAKRHPR